MIIHILFISISIFVKYNSTATECTENFPCNYTTALSQIASNEKIILFDSKIQEEKHLSDFHIFIENISNACLDKIEIIGNNTLIDGTLFPSLFPSFIKINSIQIGLSNFIFYGFQSMVLYYRNSHNSTLSNILFDSNCISDQISLFSSTFSTLTISNVTFQSTLQYRSSYLFSSSSQLFFDNCQFRNISMPTFEDLFLFMIIDSQIEFNESNFTDIIFMGTGLFLITCKSTLKLNKVTLENNVYSEMITVTQNSNVFINSCKLRENKGTILTSLERSKTSLVNSIFESNVATGRFLLFVKKSKIVINYDCQFTKNVAETVLNMKGKSGFANITYSDFVANSATASFFTSLSQSKLCVTKCLFKSNTANYQFILISNQATGIFNDIEFSEVRSSLFKVTQFSSLNCTNAVFAGFPFLPNSIISVKKSSSLTVVSSQFNVQSINGLLIDTKIASKISLIDCTFDGALSDTVSDKKACVNCTFRRPDIARKSGFLKSISYFKAFYILMSSFAVFEVGKLIFSCAYYLNENER